MVRPLRVEYAGAYYHVINRGNARGKIFYSDSDRDRFLQYLAISSERFSITRNEGVKKEGHILNNNY